MVALALLGVLGFQVFGKPEYRSVARLRLAVNPYAVPERMPMPLLSEAGVRGTMQTDPVKQRVQSKLEWSLSNEEYAESLELHSCLPEWSLAEGAYFEIAATASEPKRARELCAVVGDELSGRCLELSAQMDDIALEIKQSQALGPLNAWQHEWGFQTGAQLKAAAPKMRAELEQAMVATLTQIRRVEDSSSVKPSEQSEKDLLLLARQEAALNKVWAKGRNDELAWALEEDVRKRRVELAEALAADRVAAVTRLQEMLDKFKERYAELQPDNIEAAVAEYTALEQALAEVLEIEPHGKMPGVMCDYVVTPSRPYRLASQVTLPLAGVLALALFGGLFWPSAATDGS